MTDVDSRLNAILAADLAGPVQELLDVMVAEETAMLNAAIEEKEILRAGLSRDLAQAHRREDILNKALAQQTESSAKMYDFLHAALYSKNIFARFAARFAGWKKIDGKYELLKLETAAEGLGEMAFQDAKWGPGRQQPNGTGSFWAPARDMHQKMTDIHMREGKVTWTDILLEEVYEALAESNPRKLKKELIQVAAVCLSWVVSLKLQRAKG